MAVTLGAIIFDPDSTAVRETHDEVGGRRERVIEISGIVAGVPDETAIHDTLDAILNAASVDDYGAELSVRPGRRMFVRRSEFVRNVAARALTGAFVLKLAARDPFEESTALHSVAWPITASGATLELTTAGNAPARPVIRLTATDTIVNPAFSDGTRILSYSGTLSAGDELVFDGASASATLNGGDVLPYVSGEFPELSPGGTTLTYSDDATSTHNASVTVEYRDRWW